MTKEHVHRRYCNRCKSAKDDLMKASRTETKTKLIQYYVCRTCNRARMKAYYHSLTGEAKKRFSERANRWYKKRHVSVK